MNKNIKKVGISLSLLSLMMVTGCAKENNEEEPTTKNNVISSETTKINEESNTSSFANNSDDKAQNEPVTDTSSETLIQDATKYGHEMVGELTKIIYNVDNLTEEEVLPKIKELIKDDLAAESFYGFVDSYDTRQLTVDNIAYDKESVQVFEQGGFYYYKSTVESNLLDKDRLRDEAISYLLQLRKTEKGEFVLMNVRPELGHLVEGHLNMAISAEYDIIKNKVSNVLENAMGFKSDSLSEAKNNLREYFRNEEDMEQLLATMNFKSGSSRELKYIIFDDNLLEMEYPSEDGLSSMAGLKGEGVLGVVYVEKGKTQKEAFTFDILMTRENPEYEEYGYIIEDITVQKGNFDWSKDN